MLQLVALTIAVVSSTGAAEVQFNDAMALAARGEHREAVDRLLEIRRTQPDDAFADDALLEAGRISESYLRDPVRARDLYAEVVDRYPDSRSAPRAQARLILLNRGLASGEAGGPILARYLSAVHSAGDHRQSIDTVLSLLANNPDFALALDAELWLGSALLIDGQPSDSLHWFERAESRASHLGLSDRIAEARLGQARAWTAQGSFEPAKQVLEIFLDDPDPAHRSAARQGLLRLERLARRERLARYAWIALALLLGALLISARVGLGSWAVVGRGLVRPPAEVLFAGPVLLAMMLLSRTGFEPISRALHFLTPMALVVMWGSGSVLMACRGPGRGHRIRVVAHVLGSALAIVCLIYISLEREQLVELVIETWQNGPDS